MARLHGPKEALASLSQLGGITNSSGDALAAIPLGTLLLYAAVAKTAAFWKEDAAGHPAVGSASGALCEAALGIWMISGWQWSAARRVATASFAVFAVSSAVNVVASEPSCGCFGALRVSPWFSLAIDILGITILSRWPLVAAWRCKVSQGSLIAAIGVASVCAGILVAVLAGGRSERSTVAAVQVGDWLPLIDEVDIADQLRRGSWRILFFDQRCPQCGEELAQYLGRNQRLAERQTRERGIAIVDLSSYGPIQIARAQSVRIGRLLKPRRFTISLPLEVDLDDGVVVATSY